MMTSFPENIPSILNAIVKVNPSKILDIWFWFWKFWLLAREAIYSIRAEKWELLPKDNISVDWIEIAKYFLSLPYYKVIYDKTFDDLSCVVDGKGKDKEANKYDLALLIDVIEHGSKEYWIEMLTKLLKNCNNILISTPKSVVFYKEDYYWEDCPKHETQWTKDDFSWFNIEDYSTEFSYIYLLHA